MSFKRIISSNSWLSIKQRSFYNQLCARCPFTYRSFTTNQNQTLCKEPTTFAKRYANRNKETGKVKLIVGDYTTADKTFTGNDVQTYSDITGDDNPVHNVNNDDAAQDAGFNASICHGMFSGALFSAAVGGALPGSILVEKTLKWKKPLYINESLHARVQVSKVLSRKKLVLCDMWAKNQSDEVVVEGKVTILVRDLDESSK
eukprot:507609_1